MKKILIVSILAFNFSALAANQWMQLNNLCFFAGYSGGNRLQAEKECNDTLTSLNMLATNNVVIQATCKFDSLGKCGSQHIILEAKTLIIEDPKSCK